MLIDPCNDRFAFFMTNNFYETIVDGDLHIGHLAWLLHVLNNSFTIKRNKCYDIILLIWCILVNFDKILSVFSDLNIYIYLFLFSFFFFQWLVIDCAGAYQFFLLICRSFSGRLRGGEVCKIVEIKGLGVYCSKLQSDDNLKSFNDIADFKFWSNARAEGNKIDDILRPFDVTVSLVVCKLKTFIAACLALDTFDLCVPFFFFFS